jgi:hypothetical protein
MRNSKLKKIILSVSFIFIFLCSLAPARGANGKKVTSTGEARIIKGNTMTARDSAINDAMQKTVVNSVYRLISSVTITDNLQLITDEIYKKADTYVESFKILNESTVEKPVEEGDESIEEVAKDNFYTVTIELYLSFKNIMDDLIALKLLSEEKNLPRFAIFIAQKNIKTGRYEYWWSKDKNYYTKRTKAEAEMTKRFMEHGMYPADKSKMVAALKTSRTKSISDITDEAAIKLAKNTGAELIIVGKGLSQVTGSSPGTRVKALLANINARVLDISSGIIASDSASEKVLHVNKVMGADEATAKASFMLADLLMESIKDEYLEDEPDDTTITLNVSGITKNTYLDFMSALKHDIKSVSSMTQKSFTSGGLASIELNIKGTSESFANDLLKHDLPDFSVEVTSFTPDSVQVVLIVKDTKEK